jgi:hypothetical protein
MLYKRKQNASKIPEIFKNRYVAIPSDFTLARQFLSISFILHFTATWHLISF